MQISRGCSQSRRVAPEQIAECAKSCPSECSPSTQANIDPDLTFLLSDTRSQTSVRSADPASPLQWIMTSRGFFSNKENNELNFIETPPTDPKSNFSTGMSKRSRNHFFIISPSVNLFLSLREHFPREISALYPRRSI